MRIRKDHLKTNSTLIFEVQIHKANSNINTIPLHNLMYVHLIFLLLSKFSVTY